MTTAQAALTVSIAAALVAMFGAVTSYRTLRWQKARDADRTRARARIEIEQSMVFGQEDGRPLGTLTPDELVRLCRFRVAIAVVNESEEAAIFVRDLLLVGAQSNSGPVLLAAEEPDARLEPRERLVRQVELEHQDVEQFETFGFTARATLSTGELFEARDRLIPDLMSMPGVIPEAHRRRTGATTTLDP